MVNKSKYIAFSLVLLGIDQLIKYFFYTQPERLGIFGYYLNENFSWSLPVSNTVVIVLTVLSLLGIIYWRKKLFGPSMAWYLMAAGAVSNLIDRLARGGVVDYIFLPYGGIINLADLMILSGMAWIVLSSYGNRPNKPIN